MELIYFLIVVGVVAIIGIIWNLIGMKHDTVAQ